MKFLASYLESSTLYLNISQIQPISYRVEMHIKESDGPRWVGPDDFMDTLKIDALHIMLKAPKNIMEIE